MHNLNKSAERKNSQKNLEEMFIISTSLNVSSLLVRPPSWMEDRNVWHNFERGPPKDHPTQALVSFKKYMPPPLPYFKVNICPLPLPHFASIFFRLFVILSLTQLYRYTPEIVLFSTDTFKYKYRPPSDELDKNIQRKSHFLFFSHWQQV